MFPVRVRWIEVQGRFRLTQSPCPRGGDELLVDLRKLKAEGVDVVVSLLTHDDEIAFGLESEGETARSIGLEFVNFPITDHTVPDEPQPALELVDRIVGMLEAGRGVLLHCYAGIGRSGLIAIATLLKTGFDLEDARRRASLARNLPVPETYEQVEWLKAHVIPKTPATEG